MGSKRFNKIKPIAKLTAGTVAPLYDFDVNQAVASAGAVEWNATGKHPQQHKDANSRILKDIILENKQYILIGTSFIPIVGDIQGFVEAQTTGDYVFATIGILPGLGDLSQKAHRANKAYELAKSTNNVAGMKSAIQEGVDVLKATGRAEVVSGRSVTSRINIANGRTAFTPLRHNGRPVDAGFQHVLDGHFNRSLANNRSVFSITPDELKTISSNRHTISSPVRQVDRGHFERIVNIGRVVGKTNLNQGGADTTYIRILTDAKGNLISTYPVNGAVQ